MNASAANRPAYTEAVVYQTAPSARRPLSSEHRAFEPLEQPDENYTRYLSTSMGPSRPSRALAGRSPTPARKTLATLAGGAGGFLRACFDPARAAATPSAGPPSIAAITPPDVLLGRRRGRHRVETSASSPTGGPAFPTSSGRSPPRGGTSGSTVAVEPPGVDEDQR